MQLGHHFGKRKPRWNAFHEQFRIYFQSLENTILKSSLIMSIVQFLILAPLLYWTLENYSLFEQFIPNKTHLKENILGEKHWILFLFAASFALSVFTNYQFIKILIAKIKGDLFERQASEQIHISGRTSSFAVAADQRRAS